MRARYYEPWTGRFLSEDPARDGVNWFTYCNNNAVDNVDFDGKLLDWVGAGQGVLWGMMIGFFGMLTYKLLVLDDRYDIKLSTAIFVMAISFFGRGVANVLGSGRDRAVPWKQFLKSSSRAILGGLVSGGAIGYIVQSYLGIQAGNVMWYLFELHAFEEGISL